MERKDSRLGSGGCSIVSREHRRVGGGCWLWEGRGESREGKGMWLDPMTLVVWGEKVIE